MTYDEFTDDTTFDDEFTSDTTYDDEFFDDEISDDDLLGLLLGRRRRVVLRRRRLLQRAAQHGEPEPADPTGAVRAAARPPRRPNRRTRRRPRRPRTPRRARAALRRASPPRRARPRRRRPDAAASVEACRREGHGDHLSPCGPVGGSLLAGLEGHGLFVADTGDTSWIRLATPRSPQEPQAFVADPHGSGRLLGRRDARCLPARRHDAQPRAGRAANVVSLAVILGRQTGCWPATRRRCSARAGAARGSGHAALATGEAGSAVCVVDGDTVLLGTSIGVREGSGGRRGIGAEPPARGRRPRRRGRVMSWPRAGGRRAAVTGAPEAGLLATTPRRHPGHDDEPRRARRRPADHRRFEQLVLSTDGAAWTTSARRCRPASNRRGWRVTARRRSCGRRTAARTSSPAPARLINEPGGILTSR